MFDFKLLFSIFLPLAKFADILEIAEAALPAGRRLKIALFNFLYLLRYFLF